jgi:NAD-dependent dihydropyrimidine dehydrogenase PreA subunit/flavodoxin
MSTGIYYFSGTGNSLYVAKDIAEKTGATLYPIASLVNQTVIDIDSEVIGIVFPVYYGELPVIIKRFARKLNDIENKYVFAVCTFGGSAGYSLKRLRSIIRSRGGELSATYRVHMPQNSFYKPWEKHARLYANWKKEVGHVVRKTNNRVKGEFLRNYLTAPFFMIVDYIVELMRPQYRKSFIKLSNASPDLSTDELIHLNDTSYSADEKCNGCGLCAKVCPVNNIEMRDGRPVWLHHCENCLACYNWCPNKAIRGGIAAEGYYYRHPDIKITEIMKQRSDYTDEQKPGRAGVA